MKRNNLNSKFSWSGIFVIVMTFVFLFMHTYNRTVNYGNYHNIISWDVLSYYLYLPFTFIYNDIGMQNQEVIKYIFETYNPSSTFYQAYVLPTGNWVPAYTMGFAILFLPFFLIAHVWALLSDYPADGFSYPYQFCIANGVMLYILPGLFIIRKFLLRYFEDRVVLFSLILVVLGTNYFHEVYNDSTMPHAMLFTGFALFIYLIDLWYANPTKKISFLLGLLTGIILLCRGSEVVLIFIALFWKVKDTKDLKDRFRFYLTKWVYLSILVFSVFLVFLPQFIHWKVMSGSFIFNSYQNTEGVDWIHPNIWNVLFSFKKSLLVYTPLYLLMFIGILMMRKRMPELFLPIILFFIANLYLLSCWAAWWNGFSFGMRYFVESFAIMTIPLAVFGDWLFQQRKLLRGSLVLFLLFFIFLNLFQTWQYTHGIIDGARMTKKYYSAVFLKTHVLDDARSLLEVNRSDSEIGSFDNPQDYNMRMLAFFDFDSLNSASIQSQNQDSTVRLSGLYSYRLDSNTIYSPTLKMPYFLLTNSDHAWIRVKLNYYSEYDISENPASLVVTMSRYGKGGRPNNKYRAVDLEKRDFVKGRWNTIVFDYQTPYPLHMKDELTVYVWHRGKYPFYIEDMKIDNFTPKP